MISPDPQWLRDSIYARKIRNKRANIAKSQEGANNKILSKYGWESINKRSRTMKQIPLGPERKD